MQIDELLMRFERVAEARGVSLATLGKLTVQNTKAYDSLKARRMWPLTQERLAAALDQIEAELAAKDCA